MSGLTLEHGGMVVVKDIQKVRNQTLGTDQSFETNGAVKVPVNPVYSFFLTPSIIIAEVRENSPAAIAGLLKGDEILTVNGKPSYKYQLYELTNMFYSKEGRKINMEIEREEKIFNVIFNLEKVL
jgi:C-terminal processing protease CtpA/Prc